MQKKVIIAALDWGLGHATRMIPIVQYFIANDWKVILASSGNAAIMWQQKFPNIEITELPAYNFNYSHNSMLVNVISQIPKIRKVIRAENALIRKLVLEHKPILIISDNRYGVYHNDVKSVFITHQLQVLPPNRLSFSTPIIRVLHEQFINKFTQIWVPDFAGENNLSGKLSHGFTSKLDVKFIGPISRFEEIKNNKELDRSKYPNILAIISGPEPSRTDLEKLLISKLRNYKGKSVILLGKPKKDSIVENDNLKIYNHLQDDEFKAELLNADLVIARSGYSTIMDLYNLKKKAVFIPTPGQTEQEYLAEKFYNDGMFYTMKQSGFDLNTAINKQIDYGGFTTSFNTISINFSIEFSKVIKDLLPY
ncbi:MAG: hypothetical protein KAG84_05975 [Bacteroidales bacterium]|nr:hypothetical protein [Bacteroidales bacterium]